MKKENSHEKTDIGTITRTILIIIALINQGFVIAGKNPLPFEDDQIAQVISFGFTTVTAIIAWWKNNNFSQEAKEAQALSGRFEICQEEARKWPS